MNEVKKMYENALNLKQKCSSPYVDPEYCAKDCKECKDFRYDYPPFTAEKQIELIKWMIKTNHRYFIQDIIADDFSETLAGVFNFYWQYLTDEERKQVKEILE